MDFGLARPAGAAAEDSSSSLSSSPLGEAGTATGTLLGTPAYMAPEQLLGKTTDARSDQFSFCVALHEALTGERPVQGEDVPSLRKAIAEGQPRRTARLPAWLRRVLARGLRADPIDRYPSMRELLDELGRDPAATRRRALMVGAALAILLSVGVVLSRAAE